MTYLWAAALTLIIAIETLTTTLAQSAQPAQAAQPARSEQGAPKAKPPEIYKVTKVVKVDGGLIEGKIEGDILYFKGIPYAAPPVGPNRWRAPQPVQAWSDVKSAKSFGHDCMQTPTRGDAAVLDTRPEEDCLYINVWRPSFSMGGVKLPVVVWIHGGAFVNGGSSAPIFDGDAFARKGVALVSFNYRLGRFGFFAHPALTAAKEGPIGNFGYMDQVAALRWVKRNIGAFGGDSAQVTVMGESAGGIAIMDMLGSQAEAGLFQRAIIMSGGGRRPLIGGVPFSGGSKEVPSAEKIGMSFAKSVGIEGQDSAALAALRGLSARKVGGNLNVTTLLSKPLNETYFSGPLVDGMTYIAPPEEILREGKAAKVPLLIGTTDEDITVPLRPTGKGEVFALFGPDSAKAREAYDIHDTVELARLARMVGADRDMNEPARFVTRQMTAAGNPVYLYRFSYVPEKLRHKETGAGHASEVPFVFSTVEERYGRVATDADKATGHFVNAYFTNFIINGDPNGPGMPIWYRYNPAVPELMSITSNQGPIMQPDPWKPRLDLVEKSVEGEPRKAEGEVKPPAPPSG